MLLANPSGRKKGRKVAKSKKSKPRRTVSSVSRTTTTKRYRRNPSVRKGIMDSGKKAVVGGIGAVASSVVGNRLAGVLGLDTTDPVQGALVQAGASIALALVADKAF